MNSLSRRLFLHLCGLSTFSLLFHHRVTKAATKPNILFIMADDLGFECLEAYGGTSYKTPHLSQLAQEGGLFTHCYSTPLCSPTRVQLMTGRYPFRTGWTKLISSRPDDLEFLDTGKETTFAHVLKAAGYKTVCVGKWQLAHFDQIPDHVVQSGFDSYSCWAWKYGGSKLSRYWQPGIWQDGKLRNDVTDKYGPDVVSDYLINFIRQNKDTPFFAYYPMILTHSPFVPTPDSADDPNSTIQENFRDMVQYMDKIVGNIVATLDELGLRENTLIFFTGDNGTNKNITSNLGDVEIMGGKGKLTDAGTHVPLIVNWKGTIEPGQICHNLVDFSDFFPTLADFAEASLPAGVTIDGKSLKSALTGENENPREWIFVQLGDNYFIRNHRWKLFKNDNLYDMENDPLEQQPVTPDNDSIESKEIRTYFKSRLDELFSLATIVPSHAPNEGYILGLKCYPNPFNSQTVIDYSTSSSVYVSLSVYNMRGRKVAKLVSSKMPAGSYQVVWDGRDDAGKNVSSGTYLVLLQTEAEHRVARVSLAR